MNLPPPEKIAVLGPGLLGGSLLMVLRAKHPQAHLRAWARRGDAVSRISQLGISDVASSDLQTVVDGADLVVLCTPVETMTGLAAQLTSASLAPDCVVTDVGSVKVPVVTPLEDLLGKKNIAFIGSHPMAGSERSGLDAARANLFESAACILTPTLFTPEAALQRARWLWTLCGCHVLEMPAEEHDRRIARVSHLPHLAAVAVTLAALRHESSNASCVGPGFRDTTRVASGDPGLWTGIVAQNRAEIVAALGEMRDTLGEMLAIISAMDDKALLHLLQEAQTLRDSIAPPTTEN